MNVHPTLVLVGNPFAFHPGAFQTWYRKPRVIHAAPPMSLILNLNRERLDVDVFPDDAGASTTLVERFVKADVAAPPQSNLI